MTWENSTMNKKFSISIGAVWERVPICINTREESQVHLEKWGDCLWVLISSLASHRNFPVANLQNKKKVCVLFYCRTNARDHLWLLEDGVAWKHRKHHNGDQPRGSGKGKSAFHLHGRMCLAQLVTWGWARRSFWSIMCTPEIMNHCTSSYRLLHLLINYQ